MSGQNPKWPLRTKRKTPLLPYIVLNNEVSQFMIIQYKHFLQFSIFKTISFEKIKEQMKFAADTDIIGLYLITFE